MVDLHPRLLKDCQVLGRFPLCHLLLMLDANYPWFILVPDRENISELYQLENADQAQLIKESSLLAKYLMDIFKGDKMNIAALGNIVPQCHIHHVVRYRTDPAWPEPIWGKYPAKPYMKEDIDSVIEKLKESGLTSFKSA